MPPSSAQRQGRQFPDQDSHTCRKLPWASLSADTQHPVPKSVFTHLPGSQGGFSIPGMHTQQSCLPSASCFCPRYPCIRGRCPPPAPCFSAARVLVYTQRKQCSPSLYTENSCEQASCSGLSSGSPLGQSAWPGQQGGLCIVVCAGGDSRQEAPECGRCRCPSERGCLHLLWLVQGDESARPGAVEPYTMGPWSRPLRTLADKTVYYCSKS